MPARISSTIVLASALGLAIGCADSSFDVADGSDATADDSAATDTAINTGDTGSDSTEASDGAAGFCASAIAKDFELCDDLESGAVSLRWLGVETSGGSLRVAAAGARDSTHGLVLEKSGAGAARIMPWYGAKDLVKGGTARFSVRLHTIPTDAAQTGFLGGLSVAGYEPVALAVLPLPSGGAYLELVGMLNSSRSRVGLVPAREWSEVEVRIECAAASCKAIGRIDGLTPASLGLALQPTNTETVLRVGLAVGNAGGNYVVHIDNILARFAR